MARILLIMPHLPQRMGTPYLGQQYIAASLLAAGHEVRCYDMAAIHFEGTDDDAVALVDSWQPHIVGMTLFTYNARRGYLLAGKLRDKTRMLVAGGPHPTVLPEEPVQHGFDVSVIGEGELTIVELAATIGENRGLEDIAGIVFRHDGGIATTSPRPANENLDALPYPLDSYDCYESSWYSPQGMVIPGGLMTSRGCPARCTFCANYVTGRAYRWRSAPSVVGEMLRLKEKYDVRHFPFWDDAFTARRKRLIELIDAIEAEPRLRGVTWTCITPGNMVRAADLVRMRKAGCVAINFGLESGDLNVLEVIQKGIRPQRVKTAIKAAADAGMTTIVNFMFGFPEETPEALANTRALMEELAEYTDFFNNRGVLVPFPGTAIYDTHHAGYGLDGWWLNPERIADEPNVHVLDPQQIQEYLEHDPTLDQDFFGYSDPMKEAIAECVRFKAQHNARTLERMAARHRGNPSNAAQNPLTPESTTDLLRDAAASVG